MQGLDDRSSEVFRRIVESYLGTGEPLGSRSLSRLLPMSLSPASVRNVMSDLEELGLIYAPHISAGRLPTQQGLRFFVDAFMQIGSLSEDDRREIDRQIRPDNPVENALTGASQLLSSASRGAGLVITAKNDTQLKHVEFVRLSPEKALAVLVGDRDEIENRIITLPAGTTSSQLVAAANFINAHMSGATLGEALERVAKLKETIRSELDQLSSELVEKGIAIWSGGSEEGRPAQLIVRGRSNLLNGVDGSEDLDRLRMLFDDLEKKESLSDILNLAEGGQGVRIYIGSENTLFSLSGSSLIVAPYKNTEGRIIGAVGVIGPTRLNYSRIVPMVDYTAQLMSKLPG